MSAKVSQYILQQNVISDALKLFHKLLTKTPFHFSSNNYINDDFRHIFYRDLNYFLGIPCQTCNSKLYSEFIHFIGQNPMNATYSNVFNYSNRAQLLETLNLVNEKNIHMITDIFFDSQFPINLEKVHHYDLQNDSANKIELWVDKCLQDFDFTNCIVLVCVDKIGPQISYNIFKKNCHVTVLELNDYFDPWIKQKSDLHHVDLSKFCSECNPGSIMIKKPEQKVFDLLTPELFQNVDFQSLMKIYNKDIQKLEIYYNLAKELNQNENIKSTIFWGLAQISKIKNNDDLSVRQAYMLCLTEEPNDHALFDYIKNINTNQNDYDRLKCLLHINFDNFTLDQKIFILQEIILQSYNLGLLNVSNEKCKSLQKLYDENAIQDQNFLETQKLIEFALVNQYSGEEFADQIATMVHRLKVQSSQQHKIENCTHLFFIEDKFDEQDYKKIAEVYSSNNYSIIFVFCNQDFGQNEWWIKSTCLSFDIIFSIITVPLFHHGFKMKNSLHIYLLMNVITLSQIGGKINTHNELSLMCSCFSNEKLTDLLNLFTNYQEFILTEKFDSKLEQILTVD